MNEIENEFFFIIKFLSKIIKLGDLWLNPLILQFKIELSLFMLFDVDNKALLFVLINSFINAELDPSFKMSQCVLFHYTESNVNPFIKHNTYKTMLTIELWST